MDAALSRFYENHGFKTEEVETILKVAQDRKTWELIEELEIVDNKEKVVRGIFPTPEVVNTMDHDVIDIGTYAVYRGQSNLHFVRVVAGIKWNIAGTLFVLLIANKDTSGGKHQGVGLVAKPIIGHKFLIQFENIKPDLKPEEAIISLNFRIQFVNIKLEEAIGFNYFNRQGFKKEVIAILKVAKDPKTWELIEELENVDDKEKVVRGIIPTPKVVNPTDPDVIDIGNYALSHAGTKLDFVRVVVGIKWNTISDTIYALIIVNKDGRGMIHRGKGLVLKAITGSKYLIWFKIINHAVGVYIKPDEIAAFLEVIGDYETGN